MELNLEKYFLVANEVKENLGKIIIPKLVSGERVNVLFTLGYYSPNYYYLFQLLSLSRFAKFKNVRLYFILADLDILNKKRLSAISEEEYGIIEYKLKEVKDILLSFGFDEENTYFYKLSEVWNRLIRIDPKQFINFYNGASAMPISCLKMPNELCKLHYRLAGYHFTIAYFIRAYFEVIISAYFKEIYPEDISGKIDLFIVGHAGYFMFLNIKELLIKENLLPNDTPPFLPVLDLPCFGRGHLTKTGFSVPSWNMEVQEIYEIIKANKVPAEHIKKIFTILLNEYLNEFIDFDGKKFTASKQPPKLSMHNIDEQRLLLAENLHKFLQKIREQVYASETKGYLTVSEKEKMKDLAALLNKKPAIEILSNANGTLTTSEMAKKLNMHVSNTSRMVSELKKQGLIKKDNNGNLVKTVRTVKFNLD